MQVGQLPDEERARIERSEAADYFKVHGFIEKRVLEFLRTMHAGLVPYVDYEDLSYIFPIKVLEHLSQGNPVIATRLPGLCAMVTHEENGLVVTPGDPDDLAKAISLLQADADLFNRLARNALKSIKQFDVEQKNRKIFETILSCQKN
jgi:glycosyltransferase involved in cell wall biosynthesis